MKFGIVVFPGTWSEHDCQTALNTIDGADSHFIWHKDSNLGDVDAVILPGGFSYGDYLRAGAIARFSPIMKAVAQFAKDGGTVIGICNGFQILCESNLLPGLLTYNATLKFRCHWVDLKINSRVGRFTNAIPDTQNTLKIPISHGEGNYQTDPATLRELKDNGQIVFQYATAEGSVDESANPNGSLLNIAGITNSAGNVLGMMPHPEKACDEVLGSADGNLIFRSILAFAEQKGAV